MIHPLVPVQVVFDNVITNLALPMHVVDDRIWTRWAMEATEFIGGLDRIQSLYCVSKVGDTIYSEVKDHKVELNYGVLHVDEVRYYTKDYKNKHDYAVAIFADGKEMDDSDSNVGYDFEYISKVNMIACQIVLNRKEGFVAVYGVKRPFVFSNTVGETPQLYVLNTATYLEAVGFYIMWKMALRDLHRGKQHRQSSVQYYAGMWSNFRHRAYAELMMPANQEEFKKLGEELGLGVTYTGLNPKFVSLQERQSVNIPTYTTGGISRQPQREPLQSPFEILVDELIDIDKNKQAPPNLLDW